MSFDPVGLQVALGLTGQAMAERLGVTKSMWSKIRGGREWKQGPPKKHAAKWHELEQEAGLNGVEVLGENSEEHADDV